MRNVRDVQQSVVEKGEITVLVVLYRNPNGVHMASMSPSIIDFINLHMKFKVGIRLITRWQFLFYPNLELVAYI